MYQISNIKHRLDFIVDPYAFVLGHCKTVIGPTTRPSIRKTLYFELHSSIVNIVSIYYIRYLLSTDINRHLHYTKTATVGLQIVRISIS